jgi:cytochrome bd-type quinol oxidase subunit 2
MLVVLGILAAAALGGITYLYLSSKSSKMQRLAALGALVLSGLTLLICGLILIFGNNRQKADPYAFPIAEQEAQSGAKTQVIELVIFILVLLVLFGFVLFLGYRERKRQALKEANVKKVGAGRTAKNKTGSAKGDADQDVSDFSFDDF